MKYLVVGTGRSGTGYMSKLLSLNGISCGHETVCGYPVSEDNYIENIHTTDLLAESSWLAVPFLPRIIKEFPDIKLIHIDRNPIDVIRSFYEIDFFSDERADMQSNKLVEENCGKPGDPIEAAIVYYLMWKDMIRNNLTSRNSITLRIEDVDFDVLENFIESPIHDKLGEKVNLKPKPKKLSDQELLDRITKHKLYDTLKQEAAKHGYSI